MNLLSTYRESFQHSEIENTTIQNTAMEQIKSGMAGIVFKEGKKEEGGFRTPIAHTFMYVQWETNKVIWSNIPYWGPVYGLHAVARIM